MTPKFGSKYKRRNAFWSEISNNIPQNLTANEVINIIKDVSPRIRVQKDPAAHLHSMKNELERKIELFFGPYTRVTDNLIFL